MSIDLGLMDLIALICAALALLTLLWMGWIDLKLWILPNELVAALALLALPFHFALDWLYGGWLYFVIGGIIGGGVLLLIRAVSNYFYKMETLGLGDVKLFIALGLWLGPQQVLMALSLGALCGVLHAVGIVATKKMRGEQATLKRMMLPAGPGFIMGGLIIAIWTYKDLIL